jgi:uncharacterized DUF497 family protein
MEIEFDPAKARSNLKKHGISFEEAKSCLLDSSARVCEDPDARDEVRYVLIGMSEKLRLLTVVYALRDEETVRLISARKATGKEEKAYA